MSGGLDDFRPTRADVRRFYGSGVWRALRGAVLHRDGGKCARCGATRRLEVDHIVSVSRSWAGRLDPRNLQILCAGCHQSAKRREENTCRR